MIRQIREMMARRKGVELEPGFTLIELLIVIVVLGILAATVIFALSGVTGQSATAACQSDGKSLRDRRGGVRERSGEHQQHSADHDGRVDHSDGIGGPFLHQAANNPHYVVFLGGTMDSRRD